MSRVVVWSTADGSKLREVKIPNSDKVTMSSDGKTAVLFLSYVSGSQEIWDLAEGKKLGDLGQPSSLGTKPVFVQGGKTLVLLYDAQFTPEFQVSGPGDPQAHRHHQGSHQGEVADGPRDRRRPVGGGGAGQLR